MQIASFHTEIKIWELHTFQNFLCKNNVPLHLKICFLSETMDTFEVLATKFTLQPCNFS